MYDEVYTTREGFEIPPEHIPSHKDIALAQSGDTTARDRIIEGLLEFVVENVSWFCRNNRMARPHQEDLISVGFVTLAKVIEAKLSQMNHPLGVLTYLSRAIRGELQKWLSEQIPAIRVPQKSRHRNKQAVMRKQPLVEATTVSTHGEVEFNDFVKSFSPTDQTIIKGLTQGMDYGEIKAMVRHEHAGERVNLDNRVPKIRERFTNEYELCKGE